MAGKKKGTSNVNVVDVVWDSWINSFKTFNSLQNEVEEKSIEVFESQKQWIQSTGEQLERWEESTKKLTTNWLENFQNIMNRTQLDFANQNIIDLTEKLEEYGIKTDVINFSPSKAYTELATKTHAQLEEALKIAITQQQKGRLEVLKALETYIEQLKETQNGVFTTLDSYSPVGAK
jgi:hypothetical protein